LGIQKMFRDRGWLWTDLSVHLWTYLKFLPFVVRLANACVSVDVGYTCVC
jgi:hypothetical protein